MNALISRGFILIELFLQKLTIFGFGVKPSKTYDLHLKLQKENLKNWKAKLDHFI